MKKFKPLADYKGKTFINNIIIKLDKICDQIFVVTGFNSEQLIDKVQKTISDETKLLSKLNFVYNENYEQGMFTSLQKGISGTNNCDWVLYHFVDQPGLADKFYPDFIMQADYNYNWIQPMNNGQKGHPVLLGKDLFSLILKAPDNANLRDISKNTIVKKKFWDCDYKEIFQDIDTDEDYSKLE